MARSSSGIKFFKICINCKYLYYRFTQNLKIIRQYLQNYNYIDRYQRTAYKMKKNNLELDYESYLNGLQNKQIGDYVVIKKIYQQDYATIYQASNRSTQKIVAMKVIDLKLIDQNSSQKIKSIRRRLFDTQPQLMALCNSQNIVKLEELLENDTFKIMIVEYCEKNLEDEIKASQRIEQAKAILIIKQVINGLLEMHRHNIVHRDLKVENILIHNGVYKIANFGFSKIIKPEAVRRHTTLGTISTMAPQIIAHQPYGIKVDIWSIGVIFYQMLTGILPFTPMNLNLMHSQIINSKIIDKESCLLMRGKIKCSPQAIDFLERALEINPQKRIQFSELLEHPMFKKKNEVVEISIKNIQVKEIKSTKKNLDDKGKQIIAKKKQEICASNKQQLNNKQIKKKQMEIEKKEDQIYLLDKETFLSFEKARKICDEIIQPLENSNILTYNRFEVEFMYLLISRCLFNMRNINKKIEKKGKIADNLQKNVEDVNSKVKEKLQIYSNKLTAEQTRFMSIITDKWSSLVKRGQTKEKERFLGGIEEVDFTRQQQVDYTNVKYIPEIIKTLQQKAKKNQNIVKIIQLLSCYRKINLVTLRELEGYTFQSYVQSLKK